MTDFIQAFGLLIIVIVCIAFLTKIIKQPIIIGYVLAGLLFSYFFASDESIRTLIEQLSTIGITLLLFLMGFEFDFRIFKSLGRDLLILTFGQCAVLLVIGAAILSPFHFTPLELIYLTLAFSISSTLLVAKWIEDKKETNVLYGKLSLGILVIQDIIAILGVTFLTVSTNNVLSSLFAWFHIDATLGIIKYAAMPLIGFLLLIGFAYLMSRHLLNFALRSAAQLPELLLIFSISICFLFAQVAVKLGYSATIGAFIGGVVIANTIYKADISSRLKPLVLFFNMLFFVGLGFQTGYDLSTRVLIIAAVLIVASMILKPIIVYISMRLMRYDLKTAFLTSVHLSPQSEFGIILVSSGVAIGQIDAQISSIIILSTIATMILCSYTIKYDKQLWTLCQPLLSKIDRFITTEGKDTKQETIAAQVVFFGYYESGKDILKSLLEKGKRIVVVSNDPEHIDALETAKIAYHYGSAATPDFFDHVHFQDIQLVVSSKDDVDENKLLLSRVKREYHGTILIVTARAVKDALELYKAGADYVIYPTYVNEQQVSLLLDAYTTDVDAVIKRKMSDMGRFQELLDEKQLLRKNRKADLTHNFFHDIDHLVGKLGKLQKINERTLFHLFNRAERKEKIEQKSEDEQR